MGTIEFGRAWMISNMITHAARDGARMAATWPTRTSGGGFSSSDQKTIQDDVKAKITSVLGPNSLTATLTTGTVASGSTTIPTVSIQVGGNVNYLFRLLPNMTTFSANRTVTFRDEGQ